MKSTYTKTKDVRICYCAKPRKGIVINLDSNGNQLETKGEKKLILCDYCHKILNT